MAVEEPQEVDRRPLVGRAEVRDLEHALLGLLLDRELDVAGQLAVALPAVDERLLLPALEEAVLVPLIRAPHREVVPLGEPGLHGL